MKRFIIGGLVLLAAVGVSAGLILFKPKASEPARQSTVTPSTRETRPVVTPPTDGFDKTRFSIDASDSLWVIVNKQRPLKPGYAPAELVAPAIPLRLAASEEQMKVSKVISPALEQMVASAKEDGAMLKLSSAYRSEALQRQFYTNYVAKDGVEAADRYSARPGTSEHQTGLAVDMIAVVDTCHLEVCFADTIEGKWIAAHAHEYGFVVRYLKGKEASTGYQYEPWHLRYVGQELAAELHKNGLTMEEFFGL